MLPDNVPDPWHFGTDADQDADPDPALFDSDLQGANKK